MRMTIAEAFGPDSLNENVDGLVVNGVFYPLMVDCPNCGGDGGRDVVCHVCDGTGKVPNPALVKQTRGSNMNTPQSYVKKPVVIEAMQLVEGSDNWKDVCDWIHSTDSLTGNDHRPKMLADGRVVIDTLEGVMAASPGDWVIRGIKDEFYPCKPDIFEASYDKTASKA